MDQAQLRQHVMILGWLHLVGAILVILIGIFVFLLLGGVSLAVHDHEARTVLPIVGTAVGLFLVVLGLPGLIAGYGLLQRRPWARIFGIIVGALHVFNIPVGTALGIYTFVVLADPQAEAYFRSAA